MSKNSPQRRVHPQTDCLLPGSILLTINDVIKSNSDDEWYINGCCEKGNVSLLVSYINSAVSQLTLRCAWMPLNTLPGKYLRKWLSTWPPNSFYFGQKCMKWKQFLLRRNSIQKLIGMQNGRYQLCANIYTMLQTPAAWWGTKDLFCSEHSSWGVFFSGHQEPLCHPITVEEGWDKYNKDQPSCPTCTIAKQWLKICRYVHATHRLTITSA